MNRREVLSLLPVSALLPLAACTDKSAKVRYRVIATAEVDGQRFEGSTVMEVHIARVTGAGPRGGTGKDYGEAIILELGKRGTVFVMPIETQQGSPSTFYVGAILRTLGISHGFGSLTDDDFETLKRAKGRIPLKIGDGSRLPVFVAFRDEKIPNTVYEVNPRDLVATFGAGVRFVGLEVEITDAPVTQVLKKRLQWLDKNHPLANKFDRDPPGQIRDLIDRPIGYKIWNNSFYGSGSRE